MSLQQDQALFAFVEVYINEVNVFMSNGESPDHIMDFSYDRTADITGGTFTLSVYDDTALEMEQLLYENGTSDIKIRYGWSGDKSLTSDTLAGGFITANISQYSIEFGTANTVTLSLEGVTTGVTENAQTVGSNSWSGDTYKGNPGKIVKAICEKNGWKYDIEDTQDNDKDYTQTNESDFYFIQNTLCEDAISTEGNSGYSTFFREDGVLVFRSTVIKGDSGSFNVTNKYEFYSGRANNTVISFSPEVNVVLTAASGGSINAETIDSVKNEMMSVCVSSDNYAGNANAKAYSRAVGLSSESLTSLQNKASNLWSKYASLSYAATLEILGDPTVHISSYISVAVYTKYGFLHHTSGVYQVVSASDNVSNGMYTTSLALQKQLVNSGSNVASTTPSEDTGESSAGNAEDSTEVIKDS